MAHHKRRRPKNRRAGCLMCKPHKANGAKKNGMRSKDKASVRRKIQESGADLVSTEEGEGEERAVVGRRTT